jgi:aspartate kinase
MKHPSLKNLLVMKFGGTSMGSADRMRVAAELIAKEQKHRPVAVVVSAMSKVTDLLLETLRRAEAGDRPSVDAAIETLLTRHTETCRQLLSSDAAMEDIQQLVNEFRRIANGVFMLGERPPRSVDEAIAIGERLSSAILAGYMESARAVTTLGRGGSDFSASILASALDARELWIWTDVDGIMTADPRLVKDAAVLDEVTYAEAAELAYNGAKVLHPRTLAPLVEKRIPVWSKNSFAPHKPGTKIVSHFDEPKGARAVTSMANVALISMEPANALLTGTRLMARALDALALANVEILVFTSSSYRQSFCFLIRKQDLTAALEVLESNLSIELAHGYLKPIEVDENVGLLAVVGEGMRGTPGLAGRVFTAISREEVNIIAIAQGSSELTIGIIVRVDKLDRAVRAVHEECQLGRVVAISRTSASQAFPDRE